jgi:2-polyprenyl-6-methoxyphenol hydroxylase-like FAD-dependent oxidoreductase
MSESVESVFERLVGAEPPASPEVLIDTACVLGGSIAGLLAARVLADHARSVLVIERDDVSVPGSVRRGVPQDQQVHTLLPAGRLWLDRWLPGFTAIDGRPQASGDGGFELLAISRELLETQLRACVAALPNISIRHARATGIEHRDGVVTGVRCVADDDTTTVVAADFVVDAMGRSSRLPDWLQQDGFDQPVLERVPTSINYATARFDRPAPSAELDTLCALAIYGPGAAVDGVAAAAVNAIEDQQWILMLAGYGPDRPGTTVEAMRAACAGLPPVFAEAAGGAVVRDVVTYHQAESRRRHFTGLRNFPAGVVAVGDSAASFNPAYGQGMSSAALHASCLSEYLTSEPDLTSMAADFFALQEIVIAAAWMVSAGGDSARQDALTGADVPEEVQLQRAGLAQVIGASLVDAGVARAFNEVSYMLRHPAVLGDPDLQERAAAAAGNAQDA